MKNLSSFDSTEKDKESGLGFLRSSAGASLRRSPAVDVGENDAKEERNRMLRRRAIEATEDPLADLKYLEETSLMRDYQSSLMRAVLYYPGPESDVDARTQAYRKLFSTALEYSSKLNSVLSRTLSVTPSEKKHSIAKMLPMSADIVAAAWARSEGNFSSDFVLDSSLSSIYDAREELDKLAQRYLPEGSYQRGEGKEKDFFIAKIKATLLSACLPVLSEIGSVYDPEEETLKEIVDAYHDFFVNDSLRFLDTMSTTKMKLYEEIKLDLLFSRVQGLSSMLVADVRRQMEVGELEMSREYVLKRSLPFVRGLSYQVSTMADAAVSGLKTVYPELDDEGVVSIADMGLVKRDTQSVTVSNDRAYLDQLLSAVVALSPCVKADRILAEGDNSDVAFIDLVSMVGDVSKPLFSNAVRGLDLSASEKKMATSGMLLVVSECVANAQLSGVSLSDILQEKQILKNLKISKAALQSIGSKLSVPSEDLAVVRVSDVCSVSLKEAFSSALTPIASEISYMAGDQEPKFISDLLETYKNYLVADTQRFFSLMREEEVKTNIVAKVDALQRRLKSVSALLVSDLRCFYNRNNSLPDSEFVAKESIPFVRGFAYQSDVLVNKTRGLYQVNKSDVKTILSELEFNSIRKESKNSSDVIKMKVLVENTAPVSGGPRL